MKITLTKEQYKTLIEMVYLGEWMVNACRKPDEIIKKYQDLKQHVFSFSRGEDLEDLLEFDEESGEFVLAWDFEMESEVSKYRLEFEEETFWDELLEKLSTRDVIRKCGEKAVEKMDGADFYREQIPFLEKYEKEFEQHGLDRLEIMGTEDKLSAR